MRPGSPEGTSEDRKVGTGTLGEMGGGSRWTFILVRSHEAREQFRKQGEFLRENNYYELKMGLVGGFGYSGNKIRVNFLTKKIKGEGKATLARKNRRGGLNPVRRKNSEKGREAASLGHGISGSKAHVASHACTGLAKNPMRVTLRGGGGSVGVFTLISLRWKNSRLGEFSDNPCLLRKVL